MRKHGKKDAQPKRFAIEAEDGVESRRHTQLSFESDRQTVRWSSESRRSVPIKH